MGMGDKESEGFALELILVFPFSALAALLLYQGTNPGLYYLIGIGVYFWAFGEGEVVCPMPWTLPRKKSPSKV